MITHSLQVKSVGEQNGLFLIWKLP